MTLGDKCDRDRCHCKTTVPNAVQVEKSVFCSAGCASGEGCRHPECNCAQEVGVTTAR